MVQAIIPAVIGATILGICILSPACNKYIADSLYGLYQNIGGTLKKSTNELPYLNLRHPEEEHLLDVCEKKNRKLGYSTF